MDTLTFSGGTMLGLSLTVLFWLALPVTVNPMQHYKMLKVLF